MFYLVLLSISIVDTVYSDLIFDLSIKKYRQICFFFRLRKELEEELALVQEEDPGILKSSQSSVFL